MRQFDRLYNLIMEDYYVKDIPAVDEFSKSFKQIFNIVGNKIKEDPTLVEKIQAKAQELASNPRITKARALLTAFVNIDGLNEQEQQKFDNFKKTLSGVNVNNYIHHTAQDIISLARRAGVTVKGTNGGKPKHYFGESVVKESYDPKDMYSSVYEPWPEEDFDIKIGQIFNITERQIKRRPQILTQIQSDLDGFTGRKMELARAILLSVVRNLNKIRLGFDDKDILNGIQQYLGSNLNHYLQMTTGEIIRMAKNIGVNV